MQHVRPLAWQVHTISNRVHCADVHANIAESIRTEPYLPQDCISFAGSVLVAAMAAGGARSAATRAPVLRSHNEFFYRLRRFRRRLALQAEMISARCSDLEICVAHLNARVEWVDEAMLCHQGWYAGSKACDHEG